MALKETKVIQQNSKSYGACGGLLRVIPCGANQDFQGEYWAVPRKEFGKFDGIYDFQSYSGQLAPTVDSVRVTRIQNTITTDVFWVIGTKDEVNTFCEDGTAVPTTVPTVIPEAKVCKDSLGNYTWTWDLPYAAVNFDAVASVDEARSALINTTTAALLATALEADVTVGGLGDWTSPGLGVLKFVAVTDKAVGVKFTSH